MPGPDLAGQQIAFAFLARVFAAPPSQEFLQALAQQNLIANWPIPAGNQSTAAGIQQMQSFLNSEGASNIEDLEADFTRLFAGPGKPLAPPWESYYTNPDRLLFQQETQILRELYRMHGLQDTRTAKEPEDSLALELEFASILCHESTARELRNFLNTHLVRWAPECLHLVEEHAATSYYQAAANLALGALALP